MCITSISYAYHQHIVRVVHALLGPPLPLRPLVLSQLVKFHDAFTDHNKITLVLEFMDAGSLAVSPCIVCMHVYLLLAGVRGRSNVIDRQLQVNALE